MSIWQRSQQNFADLYMFQRNNSNTNTAGLLEHPLQKHLQAFQSFMDCSLENNNKNWCLPQKSSEKQKMLSTKQLRLLHLVLMDISAGIFGHKNVDLDESETNLILFQAGKDEVWPLSPQQKYRRQWWKTKKSVPYRYPQTDRFNDLRQTVPPQKSWGVPGSSSVRSLGESLPLIWNHWSWKRLEWIHLWNWNKMCVYNSIHTLFMSRIFYEHNIYRKETYQYYYMI